MSGIESTFVFTSDELESADRNLSKALRELDVCRSIFSTLEHMLENNAGIRDYHELACLAGEGWRKCDHICELMDIPE